MSTDRTEHSYRTEFRQDFAIPAEIDALVAGEHIADTSWHNDTCPSFGLSDDDGSVFQMFVDHEDAARRELPNGRFLVCLDPTDAESTTVYEGNDLGAALRKVRDIVREELDTMIPLPAHLEAGAAS